MTVIDTPGFAEEDFEEEDKLMYGIIDELKNTVQVNLCQKLLFLHQLTHNMTTDCSLNYKFNT